MFDQIFYSLTRRNFHFHSVRAELAGLGHFLAEHRVRARALVDVGCGDGAITTALGALLESPELWGVDLNRALLTHAERRGVRTLCEDMTSLSARRRFELVVCYGCLHHVEDTCRFIRGLARLSTGHILIVDNTVRRNAWHRVTGSRYFPLESSSFAIRSVDEIVAALEGAGCRIIGVRTNRNANLWHDRSFILAAVEPIHARLEEADQAAWAPARAAREVAAGPTPSGAPLVDPSAI
jgi:cyclopropane fatty-acyl-phospholipid synthase-like methyltransferase